MKAGNIKLKTSDWMRWMLTLGLLLGVRLEAGVFTMIVLGGIVISLELQSRINRNTAKALKYLEQAQQLGKPTWRN